MKKNKILLFLLLLFLSLLLFRQYNITPRYEIKAEEMSSLANVNWNDLDSWQKGSYSYKTVEYVNNSHRVCLKEFKMVENGEVYKINLPENYTLTVREMDAEKIYVNSRTFYNATSYSPKENVKYVAVFVNEASNAKVSFDTYKEMIEAGQIYLKVEKNESDESLVDELYESADDFEVDEDLDEFDNKEIENYESYELTEQPNSGQDIITYEKEGIESMDSIVKDTTIIENCDLKDMSFWGSYKYDYNTGKLVTNHNRICLTDFKTFIEGEKFRVVVPEDMILVVREMNEDLERIVNKSLHNGGEYVPSANAVYIGIMVYKADNSHCNYDTYKNYIENGQIQFNPSKTIENMSIISDGTVVIDTNDKGILNNVNFSNLNNWKKGAYCPCGDNYSTSIAALSLKESKKIAKGTSYTLHLPDKYKMVITEFDENNNFLGRVNVLNEGVYKPGAFVYKVGISIESFDGSNVKNKVYKALVSSGDLSFK
ncbi:hypothetical protein SAMN05216249_11258 [Acetitomaculum ruminis DSM 5522]|uniref:Uncharacterized protein n=1 Tax=Acetitomaculum ruminis DSM 5522 TaxID=1120918 RepID=A0A1I0Z0L3_9FIRM|nr:hypothetical protein [Acetitomaculum ruminis]SFB19239.1 hypothetical protein SAMN05216249_11258 [Acetitomaculum ruminis DSM 5522]